MARAPLMEKWGAGAHGSTYGGSPVPCAAGLATLAVIESEGLLANASAQGDVPARRAAASLGARTRRRSPTCAASG